VIFSGKLSRAAICRCGPVTLGLVIVLACGVSAHREQGEVPFTPTGIASLTGKDVCSLGEAFPTQLGVYLDGGKEHAVQYRERDGIVAVFLLSRPTPHCGVVDASLDLTTIIRKDETVEFKCYTNHEGRTTWGKWGHVVGLANNQRGRKRFVTARLAWRVNIRGKRFEEITGEAARCDTSGYAD
jgi:hypothetical protein